MSQHINEDLCGILGIDLRQKNVTGVTLRMRPCKLPTVVVHRVLLGPVPRTESQRFELRPLNEPAPLDLDAMANEARDRVARHIDRTASRHLQEIRESFLKSCLRITVVAPIVDRIQDILKTNSFFGDADGHAVGGYVGTTKASQ